MDNANSANIGGKAPTPRGRYHSGRIAQNRRLGAGSLTGATLKDLQLKMETKIAEKEAQLPVDDITAEIRAKEKALEYERQRQAALQRRLELDQKLKELKLQNDKLSQQLGDEVSTANVTSESIQDQTRFGAKKKAVPAAVPSWLKYDKVTLTFRAWTKEKWFDSIGEGFSVRKFIIVYFMADKSIEIVEPKIPNSGTTGGIFMKRRVLTKKDGKPILPNDLAVGMRLPINGREFTVYDCEEETRKYIRDEFPNIIMAKEIEKELYHSNLIMIDNMENGKDKNHVLNTIEKDTPHLLLRAVFGRKSLSHLKNINKKKYLIIIKDAIDIARKYNQDVVDTAVELLLNMEEEKVVVEEEEEEVVVERGDA